MALTLKNKVKTILKLIVEPRVLYALLSMRGLGYLLDIGWFESFKSGKPIDKNNHPIPWFTYPAIDFLVERLKKTMQIFEFGSGNSSLFFAARVNTVVSVEHDKIWYEKISTESPANSSIIFVNDDNPKDYIKPLTTLSFNPDIIVIDGIYRNECLTNSISFLSDDGVIILDDSERTEYTIGIDTLVETGFRRIDFWGFSPGYLYKKSTTIFYRPNNCLNI